MLWGFGEKTILNDKRKISDIVLGDKIENNTVKAIIKIDKNFITEYSYKCKEKTIDISGNQLVLENDNWVRVHKSVQSQKIKKSDHNYYINFCTNSNKLSINNILFRDCLEVSDIIVNDVIDNYICLYDINLL